jgi:hypothetical protein
MRPTGEPMGWGQRARPWTRARCWCHLRVVVGLLLHPLSMASFRLSGHDLRIETGRHEGLPRNERFCCRCKRLLGEDFMAPIDYEEHLLFSCESTKDIRLRFAGLSMSSLRKLMQCEDVGSVAWFVHECMERVDNSHTG